MNGTLARLKKIALVVVAGIIASAFSVGFKHLISKDVGGACSEPDSCRGALCVGATRYSRAKDGYCSKPCAADLDCPAGFRCLALEVEEMGRASRQMRACLR